MKRFLALILVMLVAIGLFCGCGGSDENPSDTVQTEGIVNFAEKGFSIVRPEGDDIIFGFATKIFKAVKEKTGKTLQNTDDAYEENPNGEILIGFTNREESSLIFDHIIEKGTGHESEYGIAYINGKIVINAFSSAGLEAAVNKFIADYCQTGKIDAAEKYVYCQEGEQGGYRINGLRAACYRIVIPNFNHSYIVTRKIEELCELLKTDGAVPDVITDDVSALNGYEIVIGDCNRDGVKTIAEHEKYEIVNSGRTVYINGGRNYSVAYAVDLLIKQLKQSKEITVENKSGTYENKLDYRLVWTDEFDTLDLNTWNAVNEVQPYYGSFYGKGTARSTDPANFGVKDGKMYHTATYDDENFYGTYATTANSVKFTYGYTEISSSLADGDGIWHAFWTWSNAKEHIEFDIMECWSGADYYVSYVHEFLGGKHVLMYGEGTEDPHIFVKRDGFYEHEVYWKDICLDRSTNMHDQMHTFGCEWTESDVKFMRDGEITMTYVYEGTENAFLYEKPHYFILSMLVGSNMRNYPDDGNPVGQRRPKLDGEYWHNGRNTWTIEYLQLFQRDGAYLWLAE